MFRSLYNWFAMLVERCTPASPHPSSSTAHHHKTLAYSEDIPGSRCGPEDGPWPRPYQLLNETELWRELRTLARPQTLSLGPEGKFKADSINFQPSHSTKTQDRYVVTQLEVHGRMWSFTGVFDGECFSSNTLLASGVGPFVLGPLSSSL